MSILILWLVCLRALRLFLSLTAIWVFNFLLNSPEHRFELGPDACHLVGESLEIFPVGFEVVDEDTVEERKSGCSIVILGELVVI